MPNRRREDAQLDADNIVQLRTAEPAADDAGLTGDEQDCLPPHRRRIADDRRPGRPARSSASPSAPGQPETALGTRGTIPVELLDRLPIGIAVFREDDVLFANRDLLDPPWLCRIVGALAAGGGIGGLFAETSTPAVCRLGDQNRPHAPRPTAGNSPPKRASMSYRGWTARRRCCLCAIRSM